MILIEGKNLEEKEPSWALKMFNKAAEIYSTDESEGRLREAVNVVGRISRYGYAHDVCIFKIISLPLLFQASIICFIN